MDKIKVGHNLKKARMMRGLTQEKLGEIVDLSTNYIGLIERNVDTPSLHAIWSIADALGVSLDYLVGNHKMVKDLDCKCEEYLNALISQLRTMNKKQLLFLLDTVELLHKYGVATEYHEE